MVRLLGAARTVPLRTRCARTLYDRHSAAQRDGDAPHGPHAQQYVAGRADPPRPHAGKKCLLGAGYGPRLDRYRGEGGGQAQGARHREVVAHAREVPRIRVGVEGAVRRRDSAATAQAGGFVRLGPHLFHDGRHPHRGGHQGLLRPLPQGAHLPRRAHGQLGSRGQDRAVGRRGGLQGVARQALLPTLCGRGDGQVPRRGYDAPRDHSGRYGAVRQSRRRALRVAAAGRPRGGAARRALDSGDPRHVCRHRLRYGCLEGDAGARRERLHAGREIRVGDDRHLQRRRDDQRQGGYLRRDGSLRAAPRDRGRPATCRPARKDRGVHEQRGLLRAHGRGYRAEAFDAVVPFDGGAGEARHARRHGGRNPFRPRKIQEYLPSLDGEHQGLVHLAPVVVGAAHSRLLPAQGRLRGGRNGRGGAGAGPREDG